MKTLYLDTSSSFLYCALFNDNEIIFEINEKLDKDLSKLTLSMIEKNFKNNNIEISSIDKIIVVNGPGSFTGVRIGITIAKVLSWGKKIPITTLSSLKAMALSSNSKKKYIISMIDARRGYVYTAIYNEQFESVVEEKYCSIESIMKFIKMNINDDFTIISNDDFDFKTEKYFPNYKNILKQSLKSTIINPHFINANYLKRTEAEEKNDKICNNNTM